MASVASQMRVDSSVTASGGTYAHHPQPPRDLGDRCALRQGHPRLAQLPDDLLCRKQVRDLTSEKLVWL